MQYFKPSVIKRFSKDEISDVIRMGFEKNNLHGYQFEFNVRANTINGDQVYSDDFFKYYDDTTNLRHVLPLEPPSGSSFENLVSEEWLSVIVPHRERLVWKEMIWFILGAIVFTIIITTAFFITVRTLLKQKKLSEIKSDFINNMTHEFKTPLATISLAVDALKNEKVAGVKGTHINGEGSITMLKDCPIHGNFAAMLANDPACFKHLEDVFPGRDITAHND